MSAETPGVGVVGCGATAQLNHLPALSSLGIQASVLVDADLPRAREVAAKFGAGHAASDLTGATDAMDCAIVATPPGTHAEIACDLLHRGIHVLVEKPLAVSPDEARRMVAAAEAGSAVLMPVLPRRYWHATRWLSGFLAADAGGEVQSFDCREGFAFGWPAETDYFLSSQAAGGGALIDMGSHVLDLVLLWFGDVTRISYFDDNHGGVEADCEIHLRTEGGAAGFIELSRTRELRNSILVYGRDWIVEIPDVYRNELRAQPAGLLKRSFGGVQGDRMPEQTLSDLFVTQLREFFSAISGSVDSRDTLRRAIAGLEAISTCYSERRPLALPWVE